MPDNTRCCEFQSLLTPAKPQLDCPYTAVSEKLPLCHGADKHRLFERRVKTDVVAVISIKVASWDVRPCSLVDAYQNIQTEGSSNEVTIYQTRRLHITICLTRNTERWHYIPHDLTRPAVRSRIAVLRRNKSFVTVLTPAYYCLLS